MGQGSRRRKPDLLDGLGQLVETRAVRLVLVVLIIVSVLPYPGIESSLRPLFLAVFGLELAIRGALLAYGRTLRTRSEYAFLLVDLLAFSSFLPLAEWLGPTTGVDLLTVLRLSRLAVLLRFARELARDLYSIVTRREQLQQFGLVTVAVLALAFVSAVLLTQLGIPYDYDHVSSAPEGFGDRMWWSFRQIESADNLVQNLRVHPLLAVVSLGLTIMGVFIISFIIGLGANIVGQVVRAERRRPVGYRNHSVVIGAVDDSELLVREFVRIYEKNRMLRRIRPREVWGWLFRGAPPPRRHALPRMALLGPSDEPPHYLLDRNMRWVVYRMGGPADPASLERVAASHAKRAILVADARTGEDADAVTVASLAAFRAANPTAHAFVEVLDSENEAIVRSVGGPGTFPLDVPRFLGLFLCHHLIVPGVEVLYRDLLTAAGCEFYTHVYVDPQENRALERLARRAPELSFAEMARMAYREHGVVLVGVFLGPSKLERLPGDLVPVDQLAQWINPETVGHDDDVAALGVSAGRIPTHRLRGVIGVARTYLPLRRYARHLMHAHGLAAVDEDEPADDAVDGPAEAAADGPADDAVERLLDRAHAAERPLHRVLVVGYSPAVGWLIEALARFVPDIEVVLALGAREDARTPLEGRLEALRLGLEEGEPPGPEGRTVDIARGGRVTVHTHEAADLSGFAVRCLKGQPAVDAAVFLSDPESLDRDARTLMRVLRFARALERGEVPRGDSLQVLAEFASVERGQRLAEHLTARRCGFEVDDQLRLTLVSTDQIKNYFMVHSAFVPGTTHLYDKLLGARGQEIMRLDLRGEPGARERPVTLEQLRLALRSRCAIPIAIELATGDVILNPDPDERFEPAEVKGVYVIGDSDRLPHLFPGASP